MKYLLLILVCPMSLVASMNSVHHELAVKIKETNIVLQEMETGTLEFVFTVGKMQGLFDAMEIIEQDNFRAIE